MLRSSTPPLVVCMGVSGSGKSTVGARLAARLGWSFVDADDLHPLANRAKMRAGIPLDEADRSPWLARLRAVIDEHRTVGHALVLACSALTGSSRDALTPAGVIPVYVHLQGSSSLLQARVAARRGHFMQQSLLASQQALLDPPAGAIAVDIFEPVAREVEDIVVRLGARAVWRSGG